jgi:hypothetical protein
MEDQELIKKLLNKQIPLQVVVSRPSSSKENQSATDCWIPFFDRSQYTASSEFWRIMPRPCDIKLELPHKDSIGTNYQQICDLINTGKYALRINNMHMHTQHAIMTNIFGIINKNGPLIFSRQINPNQFQNKILETKIKAWVCRNTKFENNIFELFTLVTPINEHTLYVFDYDFYLIDQLEVNPQPELSSHPSDAMLIKEKPVPAQTNANPGVHFPDARFVNLTKHQQIT